jgi:hypothetical protein
MKTLILSDENYAAILALPGVAAALSREAPKLPSDRELVAMSRNGKVPEAFVRAADYRDAGRQAAEDTRLALEDLIRSAHAAGVGPAALARWARLRPRRIYEVIA